MGKRHKNPARSLGATPGRAGEPPRAVPAKNPGGVLLTGSDRAEYNVAGGIVHAKNT